MEEIQSMSPHKVSEKKTEEATAAAGLLSAVKWLKILLEKNQHLVILPA